MNRFVEFGLLSLLIGLAVLFFVLDPSKHEIFPTCLFYSYTGFHCPGCGSQRAVHSLLHLNIQGVISNNALFLPALLLLGYHYSHKQINKRTGTKFPNIFYYRFTPWIIFTIVILFWILRNLPVYPFSILAPN